MTSYERMVEETLRSQDHMAHLRKRTGSDTNKMNLHFTDEAAMAWALAEIDRLLAAIKLFLSGASPAASGCKLFFAKDCDELSRAAMERKP